MHHTDDTLSVQEEEQANVETSKQQHLARPLLLPLLESKRYCLIDFLTQDRPVLRSSEGQRGGQEGQVGSLQPWVPRELESRDSLDRVGAKEECTEAEDKERRESAYSGNPGKA